MRSTRKESTNDNDYSTGLVGVVYGCDETWFVLICQLGVRDVRESDLAWDDALYNMTGMVYIRCNASIGASRIYFT